MQFSSGRAGISGSAEHIDFAPFRRSLEVSVHNLDRTQLDFDQNSDFEADQFTGETEGLFNEAEEMDLASELLSVSNEDELDYFLGGLLRKASRALGGALKTAEGQALGGLLRGVVKRALPIAGRVFGNIVAPGVGGALGGAAAQNLGNMFGLELEGLSNEDQEFEAAKRIVRLAGDAAQQAAMAPAGNPRVTAQSAVLQSAQRHAPGLANSQSRQRSAAHGRHHKCNCGVASGRWIRRGRHVIIVGL